MYSINQYWCQTLDQKNIITMTLRFVQLTRVVLEYAHHMELNLIKKRSANVNTNSQ